MRALKIAAAGMTAQQMRVEVISNNLANMNTTGYNARRAEFADLHYQQMVRPGTINASDGTVLPTGVQLGLGVRASAVSVMLNQGALSATGGDLDLAIEGDGYLEVTLPSGVSAYTRDGGLKLTGDGLIVTSDGYPVVPDLTVPRDTRSISINAEGEVFGYFIDEVQPQLLGQFTMAGFTNPKGLEAIGSNLFIETTASGPSVIATPGEDGLGVLRQGYLEDSSVDPVREVTDLIEAQRGYELNVPSRMITLTLADRRFSWHANMLIVSLAMFLTYFVMEPVFLSAWEGGIVPLMNDQIQLEEAFLRAMAPLREFMSARIEFDTFLALTDLRPDITSDTDISTAPLSIVVPSFLLSEMERAFQVGFIIFMPFLIIDLVVAAVLMSMGMMMVPPAIVALPFKLAFFVVADGWTLIASSLVMSYR